VPPFEHGSVLSRPLGLPALLGRIAALPGNSHFKCWQYALFELAMQDLPSMQKPSAAESRSTNVQLISARRGQAPGALSHMVAANLRALALASTIREIWAAGFMSYNAVSRELNRRNVPTLRGGKQWYPMTAGRLLVRLERTGLMPIQPPGWIAGGSTRSKCARHPHRVRRTKKLARRP
jgi:hypothetical protein